MRSRSHDAGLAPPLPAGAAEPTITPGRGTPRNVALTYFVVAALWILLSDGLLARLIEDRSMLVAAGSAKGWAFVTTTALLLYAVLEAQQRRLDTFIASAREVDARSRAVFDASPRPILVYEERTGRILAVNTAACREYGHAREAFLRLTVDDLKAPDETDFFSTAAEPEAVQRRRHVRKDGTRLVVEIVGARIDVRGQPARMAFVHDVTSRVRDEEHLRASALAFDSVSEAVAVLDPEGRLLSLNRAFARLTGFDVQGAVGRPARSLVHGSPRLLVQSLVSTGRVDGEVWLKRRDGKPFLVDLSVRAVHDDAGRVSHLVAVARDMSAEKAAEARIQALAYYDSLTGLPNRNLLEDRARQMVALHERSAEPFALLMVDLDHFKQVNDTLGHVAGDALLQTAARQIDAAVREADTAARWGGDEFVLLLPGTDQDAAARVAQRLQSSMAAPVTLEGQLVAVGASIGIAMFPRDGEEFETLLKRAGTAMQRAKDLGRNTCQFYEEQLQGDAGERVAIAGALRHALEGGRQMQVHYQPQIELATGRVVGFEALLRWRHPALGDVPPEKFIRVAETNGSMAALGDWVAEQAFAQLRALGAAGLEQATMSVNVSVAQLHDAQFAERLLALIAHAGVAPARIELEVTESVLLQHRDVVLEQLARLRKAGIGVAIDDFGTGYSSLSYLRHLPVSKIKVDRSFVLDMLHDPDAASIVEVIIALAHTLRHKVVAEGVETAEQRDQLVRLRCDHAQGFLLGRPMPGEEIRDWLGRHRARARVA